MSLNEKMVVSSEKLHISVSYLYFYNPCVDISENCKYFIAALIHNNIQSGNLQWTPTIRVKGLDKETIYFTFRLDIGITDFSDMDECATVTKHERKGK